MLIKDTIIVRLYIYASIASRHVLRDDRTLQAIFHATQILSFPSINSPSYMYLIRLKSPLCVYTIILRAAMVLRCPASFQFGLDDVYSPAARIYRCCVWRRVRAWFPFPLSENHSSPDTRSIFFFCKLVRARHSREREKNSLSASGMRIARQCVY